jgi:hypothetical protein
MRSDLTKESFQAIGVWLMDAEVILQRFNNHPQQQDEASELGQHGDGDSQRELREFTTLRLLTSQKMKPGGLRLHYTLYMSKTSFSTMKTTILTAHSTLKRNIKRTAALWTLSSVKSTMARQFSGPQGSSAKPDTAKP